MSVPYNLWLINPAKRIQTQVMNVTSWTKQDIVFYTGKNYRNTFNASWFGAPILSTGTFNPGTYTYQYMTDEFQDALFSGSSGSEGVATPPRYEKFTRSQYQFTCLAADNTTTYIAVFWEDEWVIGNTAAQNF